MLPFLTNLNHALRGLRKSPALAAIGALSLALGLGANVTIYSIVREMILDNVSARQPDRLTQLTSVNQREMPACRGALAGPLSTQRMDGWRLLRIVIFGGDWWQFNAPSTFGR